jgi:hypothetical protein
MSVFRWCCFSAEEDKSHSDGCINAQELDDPLLVDASDIDAFDADDLVALLSESDCSPYNSAESPSMKAGETDTALKSIEENRDTKDTLWGVGMRRTQFGEDKSNVDESVSEDTEKGSDVLDEQDDAREEQARDSSQGKVQEKLQQPQSQRLERGGGEEENEGEQEDEDKQQDKQQEQTTRQVEQQEQEQDMAEVEEEDSNGDDDDEEEDDEYLPPPRERAYSHAFNATFSPDEPIGMGFKRRAVAGRKGLDTVLRVVSVAVVGQGASAGVRVGDTLVCINDYRALAHTARDALKAGQLIHEARLTRNPVTITFERRGGSAPDLPDDTNGDPVLFETRNSTTRLPGSKIGGRKSVRWRNERLESFEPCCAENDGEAAATAIQASQQLLDELGGLEDPGELEDWKLLEYLTLTEIDENENLRTI